MDFVKEVPINGLGYEVQPINPEHLLLRFAHDLEFGSETRRVANDAVRILKRMDRDWMTPGRRPAGVCAASLIVSCPCRKKFSPCNMYQLSVHSDQPPESRCSS